MQAHFMTEWSQASCSAVRLECSGGWNVAESREAAEAGMRGELECAESRNVPAAEMRREQECSALE